jgi:hypothetical protein
MYYLADFGLRAVSQIFFTLLQRFLRYEEINVASYSLILSSQIRRIDGQLTLRLTFTIDFPEGSNDDLLKHH